MKTKVLNHSDKVKGICFQVKNFIGPEACDDLIRHSEELGFVTADDKYPLSYRTNKRCWENNETLATQLWNQLFKIRERNPEGNLSQALTGAVGLNPRLRYCRYDNTEQFHIHRDGRYYRSNNEFSKLTFLLYLSDSKEYQGGYTRFFSDNDQDSEIFRVKGCRGDLLIFDHTLWHEGSAISQGCKYILRSDVLFTADSETSSGGHHLGYIWALTQDNDYLISGGRDKTIKVWDKSQRLIQTIEAHDASVLSLAVKKGRLFSASRDSCIASFNKVAGGFQMDKKIQTQHRTVLTLDVELEIGVISGGADGVIRLWDEELGLIDQVEAHDGWCWQVIAIGNDKFLSVGSDGCIRSWTIADDKILPAISWKVSDSALRAACSDSDSIWVANEKGEIIHLNLSEKVIRSKRSIHKGIVRSLRYHDGSLFSCGEDGKVFQFNTADGDRFYLNSHNDFATSIALSGPLIITGGYDGRLRTVLR